MHRMCSLTESLLNTSVRKTRNKVFQRTKKGIKNILISPVLCGQKTKSSSQIYLSYGQILKALGKEKKPNKNPQKKAQKGEKYRKTKYPRDTASLPNTRKRSTMIKKHSSNKRNCVILLWKILSKAQMHKRTS